MSILIIICLKTNENTKNTNLIFMPSLCHTKTRSTRRCVVSVQRGRPMHPKWHASHPSPRKCFRHLNESKLSRFPGFWTIRSFQLSGLEGAFSIPWKTHVLGSRFEVDGNVRSQYSMNISNLELPHGLFTYSYSYSIFTHGEHIVETTTGCYISSRWFFEGHDRLTCIVFELTVMASGKEKGKGKGSPSVSMETNGKWVARWSGSLNFIICRHGSGWITTGKCFTLAVLPVFDWRICASICGSI